MSVKTFDPNQFDVIFAGYLMSGFAEGSMISLTNESNSFTDKVGVDGKVTRERMADRRATLTISLMQTSESNEDLSALYNADRDAANGAGVGEVRIVDRAGTTIFEAAKAWIQKAPDYSLEASASGLDWEIRIADLVPTYGSNPDE